MNTAAAVIVSCDSDRESGSEDLVSCTDFEAFSRDQDAEEEKFTDVQDVASSPAQLGIFLPKNVH